MATIRDVAKRAGVAPITVSRVINNSGYVSQETRKRVEAAIAELHYVPNSLARSLRFKRTHTLALVLTDITNPFWTTAARGVEDAARENGFNLILCNTDEDEKREAEYVRVLLERQVDGFLLVPACGDNRSIMLLQGQSIPFVVLDRHIPGVRVDTVRGDSFGGAFELTTHLIRLGHRRIAMLSGPPHVSTAESRVSGYRRALIYHNVPVDEDLILYGEYKEASGRDLARRALSLQPPVTALFAANNFIAIGALQTLREAGIRVPQDMALVSIDDIPQASAIYPFLTVAVQPAYEMGAIATRLLLSRLSEQSDHGPLEIVLPMTIILRESCGQHLSSA
ncbi:MAG: LacI family DNA-binding transcriptional regulator [Anaerolineae bacterium]|nr:LacI family DNA-binding transcriptional regulator [Anaerolineae bacterium]